MLCFVFNCNYELAIPFVRVKCSLRSYSYHIAKSPSLTIFDIVQLSLDKAAIDETIINNRLATDFPTQ